MLLGVLGECCCESVRCDKKVCSIPLPTHYPLPATTPPLLPPALATHIAHVPSTEVAVERTRFTEHGPHGRDLRALRAHHAV